MAYKKDRFNFRMMSKAVKLPLLMVVFLALTIQSNAYHLTGSKWEYDEYAYKINPIGVDDGTDYSALNGTIINAAAAWAGVSTTDVSITYTGLTTNTDWMVNDGENVVTWKTNGWSGSVIGLSSTWTDGGGYIIDSDIKLNTIFNSDSRLSDLITHEVGHSLGIGHTRESGESYTSEEYNAVMYWLLHSGNSMNPQDRCAITAIYPSSGSCSPTYSAGYHSCITCCGGTDPEPVSATVSNNDVIYSGTSKSVTVTVSPSGFAYTVSYYDQLSNLVPNPTNVGLYDVVINITEPGYTSEGPFYSTLKIDKKNLTVRANNTSVYFGDDEPDYTISYSGFVNGESVTNLQTAPTASITETWPVNQGSYAIYVGGASAENYYFSYYPGILTVNIRVVTNISVNNNSHTYDGTIKGITVSTEPANLQHTVQYAYYGQLTSSPIQAGYYQVLITVTEPGYTTAYLQSFLLIAQVPLTIVAENTSVLYGQTEPIYTLNYSGFVNDEDFSAIAELPHGTISETWPAPAGTYTIEIEGGNATNYYFQKYNGELTVTGYKAESVYINNLQFIYDGTSHQANVLTQPSGINYSISYYDSTNALVETPINAGKYVTKVTITETGYAPDVFIDTLIIDKAPLAITAQDTTVIYGTPAPKYLVGISGFVNNENVDVLDLLPQVDTNEEWPLLPGIFDIVIEGGNDNNYFYETVGGLLTVEPAKVETISFTDLFYHYDGLNHQATIQTQPEGVEIEVHYFDSLNYLSDENINAGNYHIEVIVTDAGYIHDTIQQTLIIEKSVIEVSVENIKVEYADPEPRFNIQYLGFVPGEDTTVIDLLPVAFTEGTWPLLPGEFTIEFISAKDNNYRFNYQTAILTVESSGAIIVVSDTLKYYNGNTQEAMVETIPPNYMKVVTYLNENLEIISPPTIPGNYFVDALITELGIEPISKRVTFTIEKAPLIIAVQSESIIYGETIPEFNYEISGYVNTENVSAISNLPTIEFDETPPLLPGDYPINAVNGLADNYSFNYTAGTLTVQPLYVEEVSISDTIYSYSGEVKSISVITNPADLAYQLVYFNSTQEIEPTPTKSDGYTYRLTITETGYSPDVFTGTLNIEPAQLYVSFDTIRKSYGDEIPEIMLNYHGFVNEETTSNIDTLPLAEEIINWPWDAGAYNLEIMGGVDQNYQFNYSQGNVIVYPAILTVTSDDFAIEYKDTLPEFTYTISGFVYGDNDALMSPKPSLTVIGEEPLQAGNHEIFASGALAGVNYIFQYNNGNLWVEPIGSVELSATIPEVIYDGEEHFIEIATLPDSISLTLAYSDTTINAGEYQLLATVNEPGYLAETDTFYLSIQKAKLIVAANNDTVLLHEEQPEYTYHIEGFIGSDTLWDIDSLPVITINEEGPLTAGTYPLVVEGGEDNNYTFEYTNGELTVIQTYKVEITAGENGSIKVDDNYYDVFEEYIIVNANSSEFNAIANDGYYFTGWDNGSEENPFMIEQINEDLQTTAQFALKVGNDALFKNDFEFKAYPNPVNAFENIKVNVDLPNGKYASATLILNDALGRTIETLHQVEPENSFKGLSQGVYTLSVQVNGEYLGHMKLMVIGY